MATNAGVTISAVVHAVQTATPASGPSEEEFVLNTDLNSYSNQTLAFATGITNYVSNDSVTLKEINYTVRIANVSAPAPDYQQQLAGQPQAEEEWSAIIGPGDFTTAADLKALFDTAVVKARSFTSY